MFSAGLLIKVRRNHVLRIRSVDIPVPGATLVDYRDATDDGWWTSVALDLLLNCHAGRR